MNKIWIASTNHAKIGGVRTAFKQLYADLEFDVAAKRVEETAAGKLQYGPLLEQPLTDEETRRCALVRLAYLRDLASMESENPEFYVAIEGGLAPYEDTFIVFSWAVVAHPGGPARAGRSASFIVPPRIAMEISKGRTMLEGCQIVCPPETNPNGRDGLIAILSGGALWRTDLSAQAVAMALLVLKNQQFYEI